MQTLFFTLVWNLCEEEPFWHEQISFIQFFCFKKLGTIQIFFAKKVTSHFYLTFRQYQLEKKTKKNRSFFIFVSKFQFAHADTQHTHALTCAS